MLVFCVLLGLAKLVVTLANSVTNVGLHTLVLVVAPNVSVSIECIKPCLLLIIFSTLV